MTQMIYFEVLGKGFAIQASDLIGVAEYCPVTTYPGLPEKVCAIVAWAGKILPVYDIVPMLNQFLSDNSGLPDQLHDFKTDSFGTSNYNQCKFLFSKREGDPSAEEFAIAVPGYVQVMMVDFTLTANDTGKGDEGDHFIVGTVKDSAGKEAYVINLKKLIGVVSSTGVSQVAA